MATVGKRPNLSLSARVAVARTASRSLLLRSEYALAHRARQSAEADQTASTPLFVADLTK